jgi:ATP-dependent helicase HrpA
MQKAVTLEEKLRKRGIAADEETIARLYEQRLPVISDIRSLLKLIKDKGSDEFLRFREEELIELEPDVDEISKYPDKIKIGNAAFPCKYRFDPGRSDDGVTMKIPLGMISQAAQENIDRFLPNLLREKIIYLLKALPKAWRHKLPAAIHVADLFLEEIPDAKKSLLFSLSRFLQDKFRVTVPQDCWDLEKLPEYLNIRYSVIDEKGEEVKSSRDISYLQRELTDKVNLDALDKIRTQWEKDNIIQWDFGALPEMIPLANQHGLIGYAYPALHISGNSINIRLFADQKQSATNHVQGVAALYSIYFVDKLKQLKKNITFSGELKTMASEVANPKLLEQSIMNRVKKDLFSVSWRRQEDFLKHAAVVNAKILQYGRQVLDSIDPVVKSFSVAHKLLHKLSLKNAGNKPLSVFLQETRADLELLTPPDFPELYSFDRMKDLPRYLKALALRAERGSLNLASAQKKMQEVMIYSQKLQQIIIIEAKTSVIPAHTLKGTNTGIQELSRFKEDISVNYSDERKKLIGEFFWMIEEYKVSLFAQELKTPYPVSPKKLNQLIKEIEETI